MNVRTASYNARPSQGAERDIRLVWVEAALAIAALAALCAAILSVPPQAAEPDDGAYHASIVAITEGHFLTLSTAQAETLAGKLRDNPAAPPNQWVEVTSGRWISEEDPGYPFLAAPAPAVGYYSVGAAVLWGAGVPRVVLRRPALARALRRAGSRWPVLLLRSGARVRLARLHADIHRRIADRGGFGRPAVDGAGDRGQLPAICTRARPRRIPSRRDRNIRPLHQHRDPRLRSRGRYRGVEAAVHETAPPRAVLVACLGSRLRRRRGHLQRPGLRRPADKRVPTRNRSRSAPARSCRICGSCPRISCRPCRCWCWD